MRKRRDLSVFSLSFLDCICCAFGAIILLFVLTLGAEHKRSEARSAIRQAIQAQRAALAQQLNTVVTSLTVAETRQEQLERQQVELDQQLQRVHAEENKVKAQRVRREKELKRTRLPVGLPVESDYLIFVIDTSGSMRHPTRGGLLPEVIEVIEETLEVYPTVAGLQVLDASGWYILRETKGRWLPDTAAVREKLASQIRDHPLRSVSNPVPGITKAIQTFKEPERNIGIYIFGDEFTGTANRVIKKIENKSLSSR